MPTHAQRKIVLGWGLTAGLLSALSILLVMALAGCSTIPAPDGTPIPQPESEDVSSWQSVCGSTTGHKWTRPASAGGTKCRLCGIQVEAPPPPPKPPEPPKPEPPPPSGAGPDPARPSLYKDGFLWKPESEHGPLAVLIPPAFTHRTTRRMTLSHGGTVIEAANRAHDDKVQPNGNREHYRFKKRGSQYPAGVLASVVCDGHEWTWKVTTPGQRSSAVPTVRKIE